MSIRTSLQWLSRRADHAAGSIKAFKARLQSLLQKAKHWFAPIKTNPVPAPAPDPLKEEGLDIDQSYEEYHRKIALLNDITVRLGIHDRISSGYKYLYEMGRRDGALGVQLQNKLSIAKATAMEMYHHISIVIKGTLAAAEAEKNTRQKIMDYDEQQHKRDQTYFDYIKYQYRFFPRSYSFPLGAMYLLIAILLFFADIPLALNLIQTGFNLPKSADEYPIENLVSADWLKVLQFNWETFTTALGISLCSIYIKIYYDENVGTPYSNKLMTSQRFHEENGISSDGPDEPMLKEIRDEQFWKKVWKSVFALFTLGTLISLAFYRIETVAEISKFTPGATGKTAIVCVTILLPLISGICLSHALTNFQNWFRMGKTRRRCDRSRGIFDRSVQAFIISDRNYSDICAAEKQVADESRMIEDFTQHLCAFYERGYGIGIMQPDKYIRGEDFFNKISEWRNLAASRKISNNIFKLSQL